MIVKDLAEWYETLRKLDYLKQNNVNLETDLPLKTGSLSY